MAFYRETDGLLQKDYKLTTSVTSFKTPKSLVDIVPTCEFGEALFIDGELQLTLRDEYIYHEMLVHPVMSSQKGPVKVLIVGGGDGCALREVLRWAAVSTVTVVDWDKELLQVFSHKYCYWNGNSFASEKVDLRCMDVLEMPTTIKYDVIFVDLTDPCYKNKESRDLYDALIRKLPDLMTPNTSIVLNAGGILPWDTEVQEWLQLRISEVFFENTSHLFRIYKTFVPSFGREWCFFFLYPEGFGVNTEALDSCQLLKYIDSRAWLLATTWTKEYEGILAWDPVKLKGYLPRL
jgi:spermidine synthase